ncbi:Alpha-tocopherol transfer protein-like, partial [Frankliniella fusca]
SHSLGYAAGGRLGARLGPPGRLGSGTPTCWAAQFAPCWPDEQRPERSRAESDRCKTFGRIKFNENASYQRSVAVLAARRGGRRDAMGLGKKLSLSRGGSKKSTSAARSRSPGGPGAQPGGQTKQDAAAVASVDQARTRTKKKNKKKKLFSGRKFWLTLRQQIYSYKCRCFNLAPGELEQKGGGGGGAPVPDVVRGAALASALAAHHLAVEDVADAVQDVLPDAAEGAAGGVQDPPWQLTGAWLQRARDELHEDPDKTPGLLDRLRGLVQEEPDLRARCDDAFLIRFLRARKFNVAKAHKTVQRYYQMKRKHPNLCRASSVERLGGIMAAELHGVLQGRDQAGCRVLAVKIDNYDGSLHTVDDFFRLNVIALEQMVRDPETQVSGINVIVDLGGFGIQHTSFLAPYYVKNTTEVIQESFPLRFKGFHVVNQPFYFGALFAIIKPFLKEKMKRRVTLYGTRFADLQKTIPASMLPAQYGGEPGGFEYKRWAGELHALEGYFSNLESFGYPDEVENSEGAGGGRRRLSLFALGRRLSQVSTDGK